MIQRVEVVQNHDRRVGGADQEIDNPGLDGETRWRQGEADILESVRSRRYSLCVGTVECVDVRDQSLIPCSYQAAQEKA